MIFENKIYFKKLVKFTSEKNTKLRLDAALVELGYYDSANKAKRALIAGEVEINGERNFKPGKNVALALQDKKKELFIGNQKLKINIRDKCPYVSRGGYKLAAALDKFNICPSGMTAYDIGASTGGFTDCLLQRGAKKVYAIDCGIGQLHQKIRNDERVVVMEKTNARHLTKEHFSDAAGIIVIDVSFISLKKIFPVVNKIGENGTIVVALIKPQFEVGKGKDLIKGVVKSEKTRKKVTDEIKQFAAELNWKILGIIESPIIGPAGNHEYLLSAKI